MEATPSGERLLVHGVEAARQAILEAGQQRGPALADEPQLARQGVRDSDRRSAEHRHQALLVRPEWRLGGEEGAERRDGPLVLGVVGELGVVVQRRVRSQRRVGVGDPDEEELLEGPLPVGDPVGCALQPGRGARLSAVDRRIGVDVGKRSQRRGDALVAEAVADRRQRSVERGRVAVLAVEARHVAEDLIDQARGAEIGRRRSGWRDRGARGTRGAPAARGARGGNGRGRASRSQPASDRPRLLGVREAQRVVGLYDGGRLIGFARAVTDGVAFVYLADVYVHPDYRGRGLGVELVREMVENGPYAERRWLLHTADAHGLYAKFGFAAPGPRLLERPPS